MKTTGRTKKALERSAENLQILKNRSKTKTAAHALVDCARKETFCNHLFRSFVFINHSIVSLRWQIFHQKVYIVKRDKEYFSLAYLHNLKYFLLREIWVLLDPSFWGRVLWIQLCPFILPSVCNTVFCCNYAGYCFCFIYVGDSFK